MKDHWELLSDPSFYIYIPKGQVNHLDLQLVLAKNWIEINKYDPESKNL